MTRTSPIWVQECVVIYLRIPLLNEKGFSINDIANIGAHATLNLNTSAFEAITDCSIALFQEGSK